MTYIDRLYNIERNMINNGYETEGINFGLVNPQRRTDYVKIKDFVVVDPADIPHGCKLVYHVEVCDQNGYYLTTKDPSEEDYVDRFFAMIYIDEEE